MNLDFLSILLPIPTVLFSLSFHEAAHAFVEKYNGKRIMASNRMASDAFNKAMYKYSRIALGG